MQCLKNPSEFKVDAWGKYVSFMKILPPEQRLIRSLTERANSSLFRREYLHLLDVPGALKNLNTRLPTALIPDVDLVYIIYTCSSE